MKLILSMFVAAVLLPDVEGRSLMFPMQTSSSFVELTPAKPLSLDAFTLCLRFATELHLPRQVILFSYRTQLVDELNLWREADGRLSLILGEKAKVSFVVPELGPLENHVCVAWERKTSRTTLYLNGRSTVSQRLQMGHGLRPGGRVIVGQDADALLGNFEADQSFVGEIFEVNLWDRVLPPDAIQQLSTGKFFSSANVIDWATVKLTSHGNVVEFQES
ncbi:C-reactive protein-like [Gadus chalcogrammus]|uniref:C-reactive protein-like n=1 Tax=Gadus chalcogrammus TaxID=1042646 RepID=UPI0024C48D78|nr:C-reactive protein-like [Gadus chalcogrammus]